ncbi:MAG TPA: hypothetical protein VII13_17580 [Vicinamibacteria bacterium]
MPLVHNVMRFVSLALVGAFACGRGAAPPGTAGGPVPSPSATAEPEGPPTISPVAAVERPLPPPPPPPEPVPGRQPVEVEMRNVDLHITEDIVLGVRHLRGRFLPAGKSDIPFLDDKGTYVVVLDSAEIAMDMRSLNVLMTDHVLGRGHSNVKRLRISTDDEGRLRQEGVLDKDIDVPFKTKGAVEATADGRLRVHAKSIKGFGLPVKPLMKLLGIEMDDMLEVEPGHGVMVDDNDLILDPQLMLPPPHIRGKVSAVRVEGDRLVQTFGSGTPKPLRPAAVSRNHIYWRGGELRFGKLTMARTDLELVDKDPKDPFDFSVDHWSEQLVAGYSRTTASRGLKAHMPDYADLRARRAAPR